MSESTQYQQFVKQFTASEWVHLAGHRLFLRYLKTNLKQAACIAADVLQRPVRGPWLSPPPLPLPAKKKAVLPKEPMTRQKRFQM